MTRPSAAEHEGRVYGMVELLDRVDRAVAAALEPVGISREGWRVLLRLARGGQTMGEIAVHASLPGATATRTVDKLVDTGLAHRSTDTVDRRRVLVRLARDGKDMIERVCRLVEQRAGVPVSDRAQLTQLLDRIAG